jgi:hypothetical protein
LVAFLQPINRAFDRLLISHRHRSDHRCELSAGRVRAQGEIEVSEYAARRLRL